MHQCKEMRMSSWISSKDVRDSRPWLWLQIEPSVSVADVAINLPEEPSSSAAVLVPSSMTVIDLASGDATTKVEVALPCTKLVPVLDAGKSKKSKKGKAIQIGPFCRAIVAATQWFANMARPLAKSAIFEDPISIDDVKQFKECLDQAKQAGRIGRFFRKYCVCGLAED